MMDDANPLLLSEIAQAYGISANTLRGALNRGELVGKKMGHFWLIDVESEQFKTWLANRPKPGRGRKKAGTENE